MANIFMYADETGNLDYDVADGGSKYFGIGTATWTGDHGAHLWQAAQLRFKHAAEGFNCPGGYHAKDDSYATRAITEVCDYHAPKDCTVVVAHWDSATSWGLQVADYGLWAVQRRLERADNRYMWAVEPTLSSEFRPWE